MAPLSRALSGIILPHDKCGSHLNNAGKTIDAELELKNFANAGMALADIWSNITIDEFPVVSEYIEKIDKIELKTKENDSWYANHVRESLYLLQGKPVDRKLFNIS